jgi:hypothetical protein
MTGPHQASCSSRAFCRQHASVVGWEVEHLVLAVCVTRPKVRFEARI